MSLIRGSNSKRPCPICLVKSDALADISTTWPLRTAADTQTVIKDARKLQSAAEREKLLSHLSLRDVDVSGLLFASLILVITPLCQNVFWNLSYSDLHRALSFDRLHSNNSGLFGHHLWEQFKNLITGYGRSQEEQVDKQ
jgi:hypothetical protein